MNRIQKNWFALSMALIVLGGCANPPRAALASAPEQDLWTGRLALRIDSDQNNSFSAGFELKGNAQTGGLSLYAPFGATIAQLAWTPNDARLRTDGNERSFESLGALVKHATGAELPIASIFQWLKGQEVSVDGWHADLRELPSGRLVARRGAPPPALELRLVLE